MTLCNLYNILKEAKKQGEGGFDMTVEQAIKKYKLEPVNVYTAKVKAKELNVEEVLYQAIIP